MISINKSKNRISAYVSKTHSYAFGRSDSELQYMTIGELLTKRAESDDKTKTAIISHHENISKTYEQLNRDVNQLANGLYNNLGLRRGDVVGHWCCNSYKLVQIQYACAKLGLILCPINPVYLAQELNYTLRKAQITALFMPGLESKQEIVNKFYKVFEETLKISDQEQTDALKLKQVIVIEGLKPNINKQGIELFMFESLISNEDTNKPDDNIPCSDDPAFILFTSGTTGKPKGALLSHFTLTNNVKIHGSFYRNSDDYHIIMCSPLPFFHCFAITVGGIFMTLKPATTVLTGYKYDLKSIVDSIAIYGCTHIILTPTIIIDILNYIERHSINLNSLKGIFMGGSTIPVELCDKINKVFPNLDDIIIGYGATETGGIATMINIRESTNRNREETVGSPYDFVQIKIVDPKSGLITRIDENGELLCRGYNVMIGYWRDEKNTKESFDETKWYKTGDLAIMDEHGYIKVIGRTKDIVIRGGENIYPREVEEILHTHPHVFDAYVIGVPDKRLGEELCAWIKLKAECNVTADDIKEFCKNTLSYFKTPRYILFVNEFPQTPAGKVKKYVMREKSCELLGLK